MIKDRLVIVHWLDTVTDHGWTERAKAATTEVHEAESVGWLLHQDAASVTLASTKSKSQVNGTITIPRVWVKNIKTIRAFS